MMYQTENSSYHWDAGDYARNSVAQQQWALALLSRIALTGGEYVLDIGCGDGKVTADIASRLTTGFVLGIDCSSDMVTLARKTFPVTRYKNLTFCQQDARALQVSDRYDLIFSNAVLHWVVDHKPVLRGMYQALKPGGRVVAQMGGKGNADRVIEAVTKTMVEPAWQSWFKSFSFPYGFYSPAEYQPWLHDAGFIIDSLELKPVLMIHDSVAQFKGWIRTTWLPYTGCVPLHMRDEFIDRVTEQYLLVNPPTAKGAVPVQMKRLEYLIRKER